MCDEASESFRCDCLGQKPVIKFLVSVELVPAWNAARMDMPDILDVIRDRLRNISFHELRVIDVVKDLQPRRVDAFAKFHSPGHVVEEASFGCSESFTV